MSEFIEETIALLAEQHIVSHWTGLPVLELFAPALLAPCNDEEVAEIFSQLAQKNVPPETLTHIRQVLAYRRLIDQLTTLFHKLRFAGFPLGPEEYQLMLTALQMGRGQEREELKRLCHLIWLSNHKDKELFNHFFKTIVTDVVRQPAAQQSNTSESKSDSETNTATTEEEQSTDQAKSSDTKPQDVRPADTPSKQPPSTPTNQTSAGASDLSPELPPLPDDDQMALMQKYDSAEEAALINFEVGDTEIEYQKFVQTTDYFPVSRRRLKQNWRYLRRMVRSGPPSEIDVNATVQKLARDGFVLQPILRPRRVNRSELLLLIDRKGSMVPFHGMGRRIEQTAAESGRLGHIEIYYFHDVPPLHRDARQLPASALYRPHNLFEKPQCISAISVEEVARKFDPAFTSVMIFSDAGAARGGWSKERIQGTARFLYQLQTLGFENVAWLNPMPKERWFTKPRDKSAGAQESAAEKKERKKREEKEKNEKNSATDIAKFVPMFSLDQASLFEAINTLRGRTDRRVTFQI